MNMDKYVNCVFLQLCFGYIYIDCSTRKNRREKEFCGGINEAIVIVVGIERETG
jgi:hypothetical protein